MQVAKVSVRCADRVNVQPYVGGSHLSWSHWRNCLPIHLPAWLYQWTCSHQELPCCDGWEGSFWRYFRATREDNPDPVGDLQHPTRVCHYPRCAHILDPLVVPLELKLTLAIGSSTQQSSMKDTTYNRSSFISILLHGCDRTNYLMMILTKHGYSFTEHEIVCDMKKLYCVLWGWDAYTYIPVAEKKLWAGWWTVDRPASEVSNFGALRPSFSPAFWVWTQWVISMKPVTTLITKCAIDRPRDLSVLW